MIFTWWEPSFIVSRNTSLIGNKIPDLEFYWSTNHEFYSRSGIWNCKSGCSADNFIRKLMLLRKNENFLEKNGFDIIAQNIEI